MTYKEQSNNNMTFADLILDYKRHQQDKVKITTYKNYNKYFSKLEPLYTIKLQEFNIKQFNIWKDNINKPDFSTRYKNNIYKFLRGLLNYAIKYHNLNGLNVTLNKMTGFNNPNELKKEMQFWNYEEFSRFIVQETELKYTCFFETLYYCGLRRGEANALNWNNLDLNKGYIKINKSITLKIKGEKYIILPPKTKNSNRILPLPNCLLNNLKLLKKEYSKYKNFNNDWFVFGGISPLADSTTTNRKNNNITKANKYESLKQIRIHDFRHSCASLLISKGASITLVAKYLGHSNIATTLNTYTHLFKNEFEDIIKIINQLEN